MSEKTAKYGASANSYVEPADNPRSRRVKHVSDLFSRKIRREMKRFLAEGPQCVREAVKYCPGDILDIYYDARLAETSETIGEIIATAKRKNIYVHPATGRVIKAMSTDCQGIIAVVSFSALKNAAKVSISRDSLVAACWEIRDPGNAGTVVRTADATGCAAVVFVGNCVDYTSAKVVRSTAGSLFHLPVFRLSEEEFFDWIGENDIKVFAADVYGTAKKRPKMLTEIVSQPDLTDSACAALFGNEARGLPEETIDKCDMTLTVPIYGSAESLNVAVSSAITLYQLATVKHENGRAAKRHEKT